ncbi:MAG: hypothetical protein PHW79_06220 [Candidatus Marinimicrobia bacterium]|nr:hypothetical protein [Candidatus Neomarinimicrobiota bacterium]
MRKSLTVFLVLIVCMLLVGCSSTLPTINGFPDKPEKEKLGYTEKNFSYTQAHQQWASISGPGKAIKASAKPEIVPADLKKVKKVAIVGFDVTVFRKGKQKKSSGLMAIADMVSDMAQAKKDMEPLQGFVNTMYDEMKKTFEKYGYEVVSVEKIKACEAYKKLEFKEEEKKVKGASAGWWKGMTGAYDLKKIEGQKVTKIPFGFKKKDELQATIEERIQGLNDVAKCVGADAVILVDNTAAMSWTFMGALKLSWGLKEKQLPGVTVDVFLADKPNLIWSAKVKPMIGIPTQVNGGLFAPYFGAKLSLEKVGPDMTKAYSDIADLLVFQFNHDQKK